MNTPETPEAPLDPESVHLREVTRETLRAILSLQVHDEQRQFVANNANSIAEAYFTKEAWFRAIYAGDTPVGFVMLYLEPEQAEYFLWRYMIDARYQGRGYGRAALQQVIDYVKTLPNARALTLSYHKATGDPEGFYRKLGFEPTGEMMEDEYIMKLELG
jgi:diamine N-acetyltransferase